MGNICRSPTAHAIFRQMIFDKGLTDMILVDSVGTHTYSIGKSPDTRSMQAALARGIDMRDLQARKINDSDYEKFDYLLVADSDNYHFTKETCPKRYQHKIKYMLDFSTQSATRDVPDPYFGAGKGFDIVLDLLEDACAGLLIELEKELGRYN